ncbi:hypothetical protein CF319_g7117 [Tilletia indica]|nr:hypothetical protein CF319_g7117 [Tilletia indica]
MRVFLRSCSFLTYNPCPPLILFLAQRWSPNERTHHTSPRRYSSPSLPDAGVLIGAALTSAPMVSIEANIILIGAALTSAPMVSIEANIITSALHAIGAALISALVDILAAFGIGAALASALMTLTMTKRLTSHLDAARH